MKIVVVCEPTLGRTVAVAAAVAAGARSAGAEVILGGPEAVSIKDLQEADLVVLGVAPGSSRPVTVGRDRVIDEGGGPPDAAVLARWIDQLDLPAGVAAAFDTRTRSRPLDAAARWIEQRLRQRGFRVAARRSFLLERSDGPLSLHELIEARAWGRALVERIRLRGEARTASGWGTELLRRSEASARTRRRAVVIDPDPDVCARAASLLTARGYRVRTRSDPAGLELGRGREAELPDPVEADLIVLRFDRTDGRSAAASLLERSLAAQRMVIVVADDDDPVHLRHDPRLLTVRPADRLELVSAIGRFDASGRERTRYV